MQWRHGGGGRGRGREGSSSASPSYFYTKTETRKAKAPRLFVQARERAPPFPPLKVWIHHCNVFESYSSLFQAFRWCSAARSQRALTPTPPPRCFSCSHLFAPSPQSERPAQVIVIMYKYSTCVLCMGYVYIRLGRYCFP